MPETGIRDGEVTVWHPADLSPRGAGEVQILSGGVLSGSALIMGGFLIRRHVGQPPLDTRERYRCYGVRRVGVAGIGIGDATGGVSVAG